jgi:hypothetical protein
MKLGLSSFELETSPELELEGSLARSRKKTLSVFSAAGQKAS